MSSHKTRGHVCEVCKKTSHNIAQYRTAHPKLIPEGLVKKRQAAMAARYCRHSGTPSCLPKCRRDRNGPPSW